MAKDILAIPVSTVASESAFSTSGRVVDEFRSSLGPKTVEALICAQDWLRSSTICIDMEQYLEDVQKYEEGNLFIFCFFSDIFYIIFNILIYVFLLFSFQKLVVMI